MGLRYRDLEHMVIPLIGIDKFQPKLGREEEIIVVSFYVKEEQPAKDLERFLEMSAIDTLDTEASPNPDKQGHYLVFVEFLRNKRFWHNLRQLIRDIENTTGELKWSVEVYKHENIYKIHDPELVKIVETDKERYLALQTDKEELKTDEFDSGLNDLESNEMVSMEAYRGPSNILESIFDYADKPVDLSTDHIQKIINKYTGLSTYKVNGLYVSDAGKESIIFKTKD